MRKHGVSEAEMLRQAGSDPRVLLDGIPVVTAVSRRRRGTPKEPQWSFAKACGTPVIAHGATALAEKCSSGRCSLWRASLAVAVMSDLALGRLRTSRLQLLR
mmetsp:Transcript_13432/g.35673  ORF Transcript_13432/g.35673 Transcript_13432/m.35673 type:complete len:102 (-) Transcript_13432:241-546(-)